MIKQINKTWENHNEFKLRFGEIPFIVCLSIVTMSSFGLFDFCYCSICQFYVAQCVCY